MNKLSCAAATLTFSALLIAPLAAAQGTGSVVESRPITPGQISTAPVSGTSNNDALQLLLDQNRQLQAEIQALRGMVEEQGFEIRKLQRDSLNRYTDTDERLRSLETGLATSASPGTVPGNSVSSALNSSANSGTSPDQTRSALSPSNSGNSTASSSIAALNSATENARPVTPSTTTARNPGGRSTLQPAVFSEQQLYQMAYDSVINSSFERSIAQFDQYLSIYPEGRFVTNGHYWKGLAYLNLNSHAEARESFEIILNEYPDSAKLPDAMYGLAQAYQGLGNVPQARQLLNDIKRRFPNTGVANLADTLLLSLD